jgi:hypothetical protein
MEQIGHAVAQAVRRRLFTATHELAPSSVHVEFVMDKVALGQVFLRFLRFYPVKIIPPLLHIHSYIFWWLHNGTFTGCSCTDTLSPHRNNNGAESILRS